MTTETWFDTAGVSIDAITWDYAADGYLTTVSDAYSGYEYDYDALGRVTSIDNATTPNIPTVVVNHTYDNLGRRTNVETSIGGTADSSTDYTYDVLNRITSINQTDANTSVGAAVTAKQVDFGYNALGQYDTITRFEGTTGSSFVAQTHYDYDDAHRLTDLVHYEGQTEGTDITSYSWTWDADNRIDSFILGRAGATDETVTYNYDDTDQLTGETYVVDSGNNETYTYDANGNRTDGTTIQPHNRLTDDGTFTYTYDAEGNRTKKTHKVSGDYTEYTWDNRNRLTRVEIFDVSVSTTTPQETVEYVYDAWDRKIGRKYDSDDAGTAFDESEWYVYDAAGKRDGVTTVPLDDIILVFDGSGSLTTRYLHGPGFDQVLASETLTGGTTIDEVYWTLTDHQGTVRSLISHDGSTVTLELHRTFDAFGNIESVPVSTPDTIDFRYAYTGREWDEVTDMQYNRSRWYDPNVGRWINEDPIGFDSGDYNLTRYAGNSSISLSDPSGRQTPNPVDEEKAAVADAVKKRNERRTRHLPPELGNRIRKGVVRGCVGYVAAELGIPYNPDNLLDPETYPALTSCFKTLKEAEAAALRTECTGKNFAGTERLARIVEIQFSTLIKSKVWKPVPKVPNGNEYDLQNNPGRPLGADGKPMNIHHLIHEGATGVLPGTYKHPTKENEFVVVRVGFGNFDYAIRMPSQKFLHAGAAGQKPTLYTEEDMDLQFQTTHHYSNRHDGSVTKPSKNTYYFDTRFFLRGL